ncbi:MAG TPA: hypothetical protein VHG08_28705 [Longimicrobium sp.]|nr:hypothetical protein [Longimicrobium sp.]
MRPIAVPLIAALCAACGPNAPPEAPQAAPAPAPAARRHPPPPAEDCRCITICFVRNGQLREVPARYNLRIGELQTVDSLPITTLAPLTGEYASVAGWYVNREPIRFRGRPYARYGFPRVLAIPEITKVGEYRGVGVYAEAADTASAARVVYLPTRPGCEFQPYTAAANE